MARFRLIIWEKKDAIRTILKINKEFLNRAGLVIAFFSSILSRREIISVGILFFLRVSLKRLMR